MTNFGETPNHEIKTTRTTADNSLDMMFMIMK